MAYSPVGRGRLLRDRHLHAVAQALNATPAQVALALAAAASGRLRDPEGRKRSAHAR